MYELSLIAVGFLVATCGWVVYYSTVIKHLHQKYVGELRRMAEVRETVPREVKRRTMWG